MTKPSDDKTGVRNTVFVFFRQTDERVAWVNRAPDAFFSYLFQGVEHYENHGWHPECNLRTLPGRLDRRIAHRLFRLLTFFGGYGGDFATVLHCRKQANKATVIYSTVDTVGIPLALFRALGFIRKPVVYMSIGLCERLDTMRDGWMKRLQVAAIRRCAVVAAYGDAEVRRLKTILGPTANVCFVPYYVDTDYWRPADTATTVDVLAYGNDSMRDFSQLAVFAERNPHRRVKIITHRDNLAGLPAFPANVDCREPVGWSELKREIAAAGVIVFPLRENRYSGATTSLLQCMAMAKAVVVSRVGAIADGYGLDDNVNCRLVPPGDAGGLADAVVDLLDHPDKASSVGRHAREHVVRSLDREQYLAAITGLFDRAAGQSCSNPRVSS